MRWGVVCVLDAMGWMHIALPAPQPQANDSKSALSAAATCMSDGEKVARKFVGDSICD